MNEPYKTKGILLHSVKYSDKGHIVYVLTEAFGRKSYWVSGSKSGRPMVSKSKVVLQPFSIIDYVGKAANKGDFHHFIEVSNSYFPEEVIFDYTKGAISLFISEVIYRVIKTGDESQILFDYIVQSIHSLNELKSGVSNFHLYFLLNLTRFLGYYPDENYEDDAFFDLTRGEYVIIRPTHNLYIEKIESRELNKLQKISISDLDSLKFNKMTRNTLVDAIIAYINYHQESNTKISSVDILREYF